MSEYLNILSEQENEIALHLTTFNGTIKEKEALIINSNIPAAYEKIFGEYYALYCQYKELETLKRIIFLQWYAVSEPFIYTGIKYFEEKIVEKCFKISGQLIELDEIDNEFEGMILHYYAVGDFYFNLYVNFSPYIDLIRNRHVKKLLRKPFVKRGRMGEYWNAINLTEI